MWGPACSVLRASVPLPGSPQGQIPDNLTYNLNKTLQTRTSLAVRWSRLQASNARIQFLVGELRSHMLHGTAKKYIYILKIKF